MVGFERGEERETNIGRAFISVVGGEQTGSFKLDIKGCGGGFGKGCSGRQNGVESIADGVAECGLVSRTAAEEVVTKAVKVLATGAGGAQRRGEEYSTEFTADGDAEFRVGKVVV